jgi:hypothetical protein
VNGRGGGRRTGGAEGGGGAHFDAEPDVGVVDERNAVFRRAGRKLLVGNFEPPVRERVNLKHFQ